MSGCSNVLDIETSVFGDLGWVVRNILEATLCDTTVVYASIAALCW